MYRLSVLRKGAVKSEPLQFFFWLLHFVRVSLPRSGSEDGLPLLILGLSDLPISSPFVGSISTKFGSNVKELVLFASPIVP